MELGNGSHDREQRGLNTTIPHDIKPGKYIVRHELIALHFATAHSNYSRIPGARLRLSSTRLATTLKLVERESLLQKE